MTIHAVISIAQVVSAIVVVIFILLQERSSGMSGAFGGTSDGGFYQTRRGIERIIFIGTIALSAVFLALSVLSLII